MKKSISLATLLILTEIFAWSSQQDLHNIPPQIIHMQTIQKNLKYLNRKLKEPIIYQTTTSITAWLAINRNIESDLEDIEKILYNETCFPPNQASARQRKRLEYVKKKAHKIEANNNELCNRLWHISQLFLQSQLWQQQNSLKFPVR